MPWVRCAFGNVFYQNLATTSMRQGYEVVLTESQEKGHFDEIGFFLWKILNYFAGVCFLFVFFCELLNYHYGCLFWFSILCLAYKQPLPFLDRLWKFLSNITFAYLTRSFSKVHELLKGDGNPIHGIRPQRWDETSITWIKTTEIHFGYIYS